MTQTAWSMREGVERMFDDTLIYEAVFYLRLDHPKLYQSPSQSSQIPARAESPHSLPSSPLSRGERVGVRGDSSPVHPRTLAAQLV